MQKEKNRRARERVSGVQDLSSRGQLAILNQVVRVELMEKVRFEQRCEESES